MPRMPGRMKTLTIHVPEGYLEALKILVDSGYYPSISEAIRIAIRDLIFSELRNLEAEAEAERFGGRKYADF